MSLYSPRVHLQQDPPRHAVVLLRRDDILDLAGRGLDLLGVDVSGRTHNGPIDAKRYGLVVQCCGKEIRDDGTRLNVKLMRLIDKFDLDLI